MMTAAEPTKAGEADAAHKQMKTRRKYDHAES